MSERKSSTAPDQLCHRLGDLVASQVPPSARALDTEQWARIGAQLDGQRRRLRRWLALACAGAAAVSLSVWLVGKRPLGYRLENCSTSPDGVISAAASGSIAFGDGSQIDVRAGTQLRLQPLPYARGADISLADGELALAIVHRPQSHWAVLAGPFRVDVTGTRFSIRWSQQRLRIAMQEGAVRVGGGPLGEATVLRGGQVLEWPPAPAPAPAAQLPGAGPEPSADAAVDRPEPSPLPRQRRRATAETPAVRRRPASGLAAATDATPPGGRVGGPSDHASGGELSPHWSPSPASAAPPEPIPLAEGGRKSPPDHRRRISIGNDGWLSGGLDGVVWLAGGAGTTISKTVMRADSNRLLPSNGELCTSGTLAALRCINEGVPQVRCNWASNWGVSIGMNVSADGKAWGESAPSAIAIAFHGRSSSYRLNAHRMGDPTSKLYCIEDYKSGQVAKPSMFKTECWDDRGETLADFSQVDTFNLALPSGMAYIAFHYCVSAIEIWP